MVPSDGDRPPPSPPAAIDETRDPGAICGRAHVTPACPGRAANCLTPPHAAFTVRTISRTVALPVLRGSIGTRGGKARNVATAVRRAHVAHRPAAALARLRPCRP